MTFSFPEDDLLGASDGFFGEEPEPGPDLFGADVTSGSTKADPFVALEEQDPFVPATPLPREAKAQSAGYVVIARKYRPQTFDQLVGQDAVQQALRGAIANNQISHAYLFSGPRGTGKTSTARILAKAVNCQSSGPRPDPCGTCSSCRAITVGSSLDVIEIDAASNTGVDNIRDLKSGVALAPFSRYKVYIVDEVHMLSNQAFNALLKTLEEPPANVIFVLATTELHKVPETIISRCQSFQFKRFSLVELKNQLGDIFDKEAAQRGISVEAGEREKILEMIARSADGGMRDAQVTLDQVLVLSRGSLDLQSVQRFLGIPESDVLDSFIAQMQARDTNALLSQIDELVANGQDLELFARNLADYTRDLLILKCFGGGAALVNLSEDRLAQMRTLTEGLSVPFLVSLGDSLLKLLEELKVSSQPRFALELAVIRLAMADPARELEELSKRVDQLEKSGPPAGGGGGGLASAVAANAMSQPRPEPKAQAPGPANLALEQANSESAPPPTPQRSEAALPPASVDASAVKPAAPVSPEELLNQLQQLTLHKHQFLHTILCDAVRVKALEQASVLLSIADKFSYDLLSRPNAQLNMRELLSEVAGREVTVRLELEPAPSIPAASPPAAPRSAPPIPGAPISPAEPTTALAIEKLDEEDDGYRRPVIYISPEIKAKAVRDLSAEEVANLLASNSQWRNLVEKARAVFKLDDSKFRFQISTI